ncbi:MULTISPECIES: polysaccharide pyruvyl transferase family protein [unclassified Sphingopyxis]|jgi:polysaccharide pyruvyl transferase WcaK-like protein|uniref:polysaccharide pyruvyl transferase family protein n=1 Tax=unclassified Sphingopyxis TaxID=2614943 RepID=UPI0025DE0D19|nr:MULTISPECIES: polysaccharide pyruvyl transferase family protein [unclassified Sphingopyxis]
METITIVDTSISTDNVGDEIIMDAVNEIVMELFPDAYIFRVPSHDALSERTRTFVRKSTWCFIGGTNLLSSVINPWNLWRLDKLAANAFGSSRTVCLGTGWNDYMEPPSAESKNLLTTALSSDYLHAVRDKYTQDHLTSIGIRSVFTSCPTTWFLTPNFCSKISNSKAKTAIITLSAWRAEIELDRAWIDVVRKSYDEVFFFSQMQDDFEYLAALGFDDIKTVAATVQAYDQFLIEHDVDFIGTRLHGGIRALQKGRRALILSIDNRAAEMGRDTGLPVLPRSDPAAIGTWIVGAPPLTITLPDNAIASWKRQFSPEARATATAVSALPETLPPPPFLKRIKPAAKMILGRR